MHLPQERPRAIAASTLVAVGWYLIQARALRRRGKAVVVIH
jgi:hypothetical protein